jgi:hypothetical protein
MLAPRTLGSETVRAVSLVGVGQPGAGLAEIRNRLTRGFRLYGIDDSLIERFE